MMVTNKESFIYFKECPSFLNKKEGLGRGSNGTLTQMP